MFTITPDISADAACSDPFEQRYGVPLPRDFDSAAREMSWPQFVERYCPAGGPVRLGSWSSAPALGAGDDYEATIAFADEITVQGVRACGPVAAVTAMLYQRGFGIEVLSFRQRRVSEGFATFVRCEHAGRVRWAAAITPDATESGVRAVIAAANLLVA